MAVKKAKKATPKIKYDPAKNYRWEPDDEFIFTGREFDIVQQALIMFVNGQATDVGNISRLLTAYQVIHQKIVEAVEAGEMEEVVLA